MCRWIFLHYFSARSRRPESLEPNLDPSRRPRMQRTEPRRPDTTQGIFTPEIETANLIRKITKYKFGIQKKSQFKSIIV